MQRSSACALQTCFLLPCCLIDGGVAAAAQETITSATTRLLSRADEEDHEDPFVEIEENEEKISDNKIVMDNCQHGLSRAAGCLINDIIATRDVLQ